MCNTFILYLRMGRPLPFGLTHNNSYTPSAALSQLPDYHYKYHMAVERQTPNATLKKSGCILINPKNGLMYNSDTLQRTATNSIMTSCTQNGSYQPQRLPTQTHIYDCPNYDVPVMEDMFPNYEDPLANVDASNDA